MISIVAFLLAVTLTTGFPHQNLHPLSDEFIHQINSNQLTWKAGRNFEIEDFELFQVLASGVKKTNRTEFHVSIHDEDQEIPESFDSRQAWPECAEIIDLIQDQARCSSCWAFGAVEAMSDRICIHSNATRKLLVSAQDLLTCGNAGSCMGGGPKTAWESWINRGIVTGGLYNSTNQGCKSYFLPPCDDHPNQCAYSVPTPPCVNRCDDPSLSYETQRTYGKSSIQIEGETQIQLEILKNGPVEATMNVYMDFANYKSGIYQHTIEYLAGAHAVKILGWGVENGTKYWLIANSWNERWGENGFFRILRGENECGIEGTIDAGLPDFSKF